MWSDNTFKKTLESITGDVVLSQGVYGFKPVIDDFGNAKYINIVTYNIKSYEDSELLSMIKSIPLDVPVNLVLNIPKKSLGTPDASKQVYWYLKTLERHKFNDLNIFFNFSNHAKLIMTNNKAYIGSQNFSDTSTNKLELGIIVDNVNNVDRINRMIFETIKYNSIRYATSDYVIKMEEIHEVMKGLLKNLRYNLFTVVVDSPYTAEIEIFDINQVHFPNEEWSRFKDLEESLFIIINDISENYEEFFDNTKAKSLRVELKNQLDLFISKLDNFREYIDSYDRRFMDRLYNIETGDTDSTMNAVLIELEDEKESYFDHLNGEELLEIFDQIAPIIESILDLVEEIKYAMLRNTVYENQKKVKN